MLASSNGHDGCLRALLERGVCADIQDKVGVIWGMQQCQLLKSLKRICVYWLVLICIEEEVELSW